MTPELKAIIEKSEKDEVVRLREENSGLRAQLAMYCMKTAKAHGDMDELRESFKVLEHLNIKPTFYLQNPCQDAEGIHIFASPEAHDILMKLKALASRSPKPLEESES